jgi:hypothetical protein
MLPAMHRFDDEFQILRWDLRELVDSGAPPSLIAAGIREHRLYPLLTNGGTTDAVLLDWVTDRREPPRDPDQPSPE